MKRLFKHKKATVSIYIAFMFTAIIIVLIGSVFAPMGVVFNTQMYTAGEDILIMANESIQNINDPVVRAAIQDNLNEALAAGQVNIQVNTDMFQYSWVFVVLLAAIVAFLATRQVVEVGRFSGGGFV